MTPIGTLIRSYAIIIVGFAVLASVITALIVSRLPQEFDTAFTIEIHPVERQQTEEYTYDGYYALQASGLFRDTLEGWLRSPAIISSIYEKAEIPMSHMSPRRLHNLFHIQQRGSQILDVRFRTRTKEEGIKVTSAAGMVLEQRIEDAYDENRSYLTFRVVTSDPYTAPVERNIFIRAIVAAFVVIVIGTSGIIFFDAMRPQGEGR